MIAEVCLHILFRTFQMIPLSSITINKCDILAALKTINVMKACGADNIPGIV